MASRIENAILEIEEYIDSCKESRLSRNTISVNKADIYELLDDLKASIPEEVSKYQKIIKNKDAILESANNQASAIIEEANKMTRQLLEEHEIMQQAYDSANKLIDDANTQAAEIKERATIEAENIRSSAVSYIDGILQVLQNVISHSMDSAKNDFDKYIQTLNSNLDTVISNREELARTMIDNNN